MNKEMRDPLSSEQYNQRGIELADRGWLTEALREFDRAIELDSQSPYPRINRASVYVEQGQHVEALEDLLTAIRLAPQEATTHYHLGVFLSRCGSLMALTELHKSLQLDPEQVDTLLHLGTTHADRGENQEAEHSFRAAMELDFTDPLVHRELGLLLLDQGKVHEAIDHIRYANEQFPEDCDIQVDLAMAYIQAGFYEKAEGILKDVVTRDPDNLHAHYNLAAIYADWDKKESSLDHLKRAVNLSHSRVFEWMTDDRMFDKLRTDRRFSLLLETDVPPDVG